MTSTFFDWLDDRTGYRTFFSVMLLEEIPGGAKWRYVWGSTLVFVFSIQLITGILLMTAYSPSDTAAWGSVHFIQYQMDFGWLIRGLHHFGSQTMMVLIALHLLQVVIAGAHLPPREVNWWLGLALLGMIFGLGLTGYLLPWDQKGYWATRVATNITGNTPVIGDFLKKMLVGGDDYGNHTLTRFYALHVGILPFTVIVLIIAHIYVFRRQGVTHPPRAVGGEMFWPGQAFRDLVACLIVFAVMVGVVIYGHGSPVDRPEPASMYEDWAHAGQKGMGANLDAPADRDTPDYPARPEWYFLFLFQLLKYFEGEHVLVGTFYIPNAAMGILFIMPLLGYGAMRKFGHAVAIIVVVSMLLAVGLLTALAFADDSPEWAPKAAQWTGTFKKEEEKELGIEKAKEKAVEDARKRAAGFVERVEHAEKLAARAASLGMAGVPDAGARMLLRNDPLTRGHELFKTNCAVCHAFTLQEGDAFEKFDNAKPKASDLGDWGTEKWVREMLNKPSDPKFFGNTALTGMTKWRKSVDKGRKKMDAAAIKAEDDDFDLIARAVADQTVPVAKRDDAWKDRHAKGLAAFKQQECNSCHTFGEEKDGVLAPVLTDWGTADWLRATMMNPGSSTRYSNNKMPFFRNKEGPGHEVLLSEFLDSYKDRENKDKFREGFDPGMVLHLSDVDRELIVRFVLRDYRVVFGGKVIAAAPK